MQVKSYIIQSFASLILGSDIFDRVKAVVVRQDDKQLSGAEKREAAVKEVKIVGIEMANWLINLAVELAVSWLRSKAK